MKKKVLSLAMILCMALSMAACGSKAEELEKEVTAIMEEVVEIAKEEASVEEVPVETTDEETVDEVVEDTDIEENKEEIIEDAGSEEKETSENLSDENVIEETTKNLSEEKVVEVPIETPVEEVVEVPVETPVEEVIEQVPVEIPVEEKAVEVPVETPVEDNKKDTAQIPVSVPENSIDNPAVNNPEPVTPPSNNSGGSAEYSGNTITTDTGFVVPLLKEFNQIGANLDNDKYSWGGEWGDPKADKFIDDMGNTLDAFGLHHDSATADFLLANQNELHWYPDSADANPHLYLKKGGDHWKLVITSPILDLKTAQANGNWPGINEWDVKYAKDALVVLLSTITPDAKELQHLIIESLYGNLDDMSRIKSDGSWVNCGDSKVCLSSWDTREGKHIYIFHIKAR